MKKPDGNQNRSTPLNNLKGTTNQIGAQTNTSVLSQTPFIL